MSSHIPVVLGDIVARIATMAPFLLSCEGSITLPTFSPCGCPSCTGHLHSAPSRRSGYEISLACVVSLDTIRHPASLLGGCCTHRRSTLFRLALCAGLLLPPWEGLVVLC